jgi:hypothetical protein
MAQQSSDESTAESLFDGNVDEFLSGPPPREADTVAITDAPRKPIRAHAESPHPHPAASMDEDDAPSLSDLPGREDWLSDESRQLRRWGVIGGAGVTAVIALIILLGFAITRKPSGTKSLTRQQPTSETEDAMKGRGASEPMAETPANAQPVRAGEPESLTDVSRGAHVKTPGEPHKPALESDVGFDENMASDTQQDDVERSTNGNGVRVKGVTARGSHGTINNGSTESSGPSESPAAAETLLEDSGATSPDGGRRTLRLPPGMRDFEDLLEPQAFESTLLLTDSPFDLIPVPGAPYDLGLAMPKPAPRPVNVTAQLGVRIPEVRFTDMPLLSFVRFLSEFTTIPITLDIDTLYRMGIPVDAPVRLEATNEEVGQILRMGLEPFQLEYRIADSQLVVSGREGEELQELTYEVLDLAGETSEGSAALESMITSLVAPATWQTRGGLGRIAVRAGQMTVTQSPAIQARIQTLCQQLRLARGLPTQGGLPPSEFSLELRIASALPRLEQTLAADFAIPAPLVSILDQLAAEVGMAFVIDWRSLIAIGWNPDSLARVELTEESLSTVLQELLGPMQLTFRVINETTLQITTPAVAAQTLELGFFPLQDLMEKDAGQKILTGVRGALGDTLGLERAGGGMRFDNPSQTLIINAPQHQLAAVARQLEQIRLEAK